MKVKTELEETKRDFKAAKGARLDTETKLEQAERTIQDLQQETEERSGRQR